MMPSVLSQERRVAVHLAKFKSKKKLWLEPAAFHLSRSGSLHFLRELTEAFAVVASEKGVVVGRLTFTEDGDPIDCARMGVGGKAIPPNVDKAISLQSDS